MTARKASIARDWMTTTSATVPQKTRTANLFDKNHVLKPEDLPILLSTEEVAQHLKMHRKTASALMQNGTIRSMKIRGRRVSTPEWIAEFMRKELARNG